MKINVHIKNKTIIINCGDGAQKIRWLGEVAVLRYDYSCGMITGLPHGLRFENGTILNMDGIINENVQEDSHIWVILKEDMESIGFENKATNSSKGKQIKFVNSTMKSTMKSKMK